MRFFDCNCMIGKWHEKHLIFDTAEGLLRQMERFRISEALVCHTHSWQSDPVEGNITLAACIADYPRLRPVLVLTPLLDQEFGGTAALARLVREHRFAAIRLFPKDQHFTLLPFNVGKIFDFAQQMGLPVMVDSEQLDGQYGALYDLLRLFPKVPVILINPHYRTFRVLYDLFAQCPNLYGDMTTFKGFDAVEHFVSQFGSERLLFATNMPFVEGSLNVGRLLYSDISDMDRENLAFRNAQRLFGMGGAANA